MSRVQLQKYLNEGPQESRKSLKSKRSIAPTGKGLKLTRNKKTESKLASVLSLRTKEDAESTNTHTQSVG
jgi:hypothetical protein